MLEQELAAAVITEARNHHFDEVGQGTPAFDFAIAGGHPMAEASLRNAIYIVANWGHGEVKPEDGEAGLVVRAARAADLTATLANELDAYRARCKARKYTGWSRASTGPIRYAD